MLRIRPQLPADTEAVRAVHTGAFPTSAEADLVAALQTRRLDLVSLLAETRGGIAGHVLLSPVTLAGVCAPEGGLGLGPVAVLPAYQGQGIGGWLIVEALAAAHRLGSRFVVLLGAPGYYTRFGFEAADRYGLANEYGAGEEFMVRPLRAGALPPEGGLIRYADEFAALENTGTPA